MSNRREFNKWLDSLKGMPAPVVLNWSEYLTQMRNMRPPIPDETARQQFLELVKKVQDDKENRYLSISGWEGAFELTGRKPPNSFHYGLESQNVPSLRLSHLSFKNLSVVASPSIEMTDIWVDTLQLKQCGNVTLMNCFIGSVKFANVAASTFEMREGAVLDIDCSAPSGQLPLTGSVYFDKNVYFPRAPGRRLKGPQPYRNMRSHMLRLENTPMVSRFHTLEQATERKMEGYGFHRGISALYELLSDYGSSALRPFLLFIVLFIVTALLLYFTDGAAIPEAQDLSGWQTSLKEDDWNARANRAFVLAGQSTLNPLGIFGVKGLLVAKTGLLALWLSFHGLLSAIFIALFIFAVRRRFKMS